MTQMLFMCVQGSPVTTVHKGYPDPSDGWRNPQPRVESQQRSLMPLGCAVHWLLGQAAPSLHMCPRPESLELLVQSHLRCVDMLMASAADIFGWARDKVI